MYTDERWYRGWNAVASIDKNGNTGWKKRLEELSGKRVIRPRIPDYLAKKSKKKEEKMKKRKMKKKQRTACEEEDESKSSIEESDLN